MAVAGFAPHIVRLAALLAQSSEPARGSPATWSGIEVVAVPPDTRCPRRDDLALAVASRVPDDVAGWLAWYRVEAKLEPPVENHLLFELRDAGGRLRLHRELSLTDEECAAAAEGLALIVERFFEAVSWTASVPLPEAPPIVERAPDAPPGRRWELQVGAAGRREITFVPALAVDLRAALTPSWVAVAGLVLQPEAVADPSSNVVELWSLPLRLSLRRVLRTRPLGFELGPALALIGERGQPVAGEGAGSPGYRLLGALGAVAAARRALSPTWAVALEVGGEVTLPGTAFSLNGEREVLRPAPVQVIGLVAISRVIAR
jgi:hypothetical protein